VIEMTITEQITRNLVDPDKHGPILKALVDILEEGGEKGLKDRIKQWVQEILETESDNEESEEA
jgi:hypothetical protein